MGKGSKRRPCQISRLEESLRWAIFQEKDPAKKRALLRELEQMLKTTREWEEIENQHYKDLEKYHQEELKKQRPDLFGSKEAHLENSSD